MAHPLRIFISSPGDVILERRHAALVIEKLAKIYARFFKIELILWEDQPMLASEHFQDNIIPPSATDIFVLIVWSRLGTPLPHKTAKRAYHGIDGRVPVTGTEWEFEDALAAKKQHGAPDLLAYRKQADATVPLKDKAAKAAGEEQWEKLNGFWKRWFEDEGVYRAAFRGFPDIEDFSVKLESDLKRLLEIRADQQDDVSDRTWHAGSPFRGLDAYRFEHAPIFFGRNIMIKAAVDQLTGHPEDRAFLLILGASGAGKSSLAQAGVLPALRGRGIVSGVGLWRHAVMRPGNPAGPFTALAEALAARDAIPELLTATQDIAALARHLRATADDPTFSFVAALERLEAAARSRNDLLQTESARLVIVVDQLEELFTTGEITAGDRASFLRCLDGIAKSGRVFVIGTMRSDYWHRAAETPLLVEMSAGSRRLDLLPPTQDEIIEIIRQPAEAAGVGFETGPGNIGLDATLAKEASTEPGALPLLSFLLDELYKADIESPGRSALQYASMNKLGGLQGAIATRAEAVFSTWPDDMKAALPKVLRTLVTVSSHNATATARSAPVSRFPDGTAAHRIVSALLDPKVRLLVAEGDGTGARVRLAHEALITHWKTARDYIGRDRRNLELRGRLEQAAALWRDSNDTSRLLGDGTPMVEAAQLLALYPDELGKDVTEFIDVSRKHWAGQQTVILVPRDLRLDLFMGIALLLIFLGSFPAAFQKWADLSNFGFSGATEIFVFISGYTMASAYYPVIRNHGLIAAVRLILTRAGQAYGAYVVLFCFYMAAVTYLALRFNDAGLINDFNLTGLIENAPETIRQTLLLRFQPVNMDPLALYIVLLPLFPLFLGLLYWRPTLALVASIGAYFLAWHFQWNLPAYPNGTWQLNPFAWQILFAFGAWSGFGGAERIRNFLRSRIVVASSIAYLLVAVVIVWQTPITDHFTQWFQHYILFLTDKTNLGILRLIHFLALATLVAQLVPRDSVSLKNYASRLIILCGQYPLELLCFGTFLSFVTWFALGVSSGDLLMQISVSAMCIAVMIAFAALQTSDNTRHVSIISTRR